MLAYILVYLSAIFSTFGTLSRNKNIELAFLGCSIIVLSLVLGLRSESIGVDTSSYYAIFDLINSEWFNEEFYNWEPGFVIVNKIINLIGGDARHAILVLSFINMIFIGLFLKDTSPNLTLSLVLFLGLSFYFSSFNIVRQTIAVSITCYAFRYLYDKKYIVWILLYLLALSFHASSLVFLLYFLTSVFKKKINLLLVLWLISLVFIFSPNLIQYIINGISFIIPSQYLLYADYLEETKSVRLRMLYSQVFFITFFVYYKRSNPSLNRELIFISMISIILVNCLTFSGYIYRLALYFTIFQIVALPIVINKFFKVKSRYIINLLVCLVMTILYFRSLLSNSQEQYPYDTWLSLTGLF